MCVAVWNSKLQCVAACVVVYRSVSQCMQCIAVCYIVLQCIDWCCFYYVLRNSLVALLELYALESFSLDPWISVFSDNFFCSVLQCVTVCYSVLQCVIVCCIVLPCRQRWSTGKTTRFKMKTPPQTMTRALMMAVMGREAACLTKRCWRLWKRWVGEGGNATLVAAPDTDI